MKKAFFLLCSLALTYQNPLLAHCQLPCGIYHDDMVFSQVDQYIETMYKGVSVLNNSKFSNVKERNEFVRWVIEKENASNEIAQLIMKYFLQQKIEAGGEGVVNQLVSAHKLLLLLVAIKQNTDLKMVNDFSKEWEKFKLMFHREDYECEMEKLRIKEDEAKQEKAKPIH